MKFLKLFESFVNNLDLNEIEFTNHWIKERGGDHIKSKVFQVSKDHPEGFYLDRIYFEENINGKKIPTILPNDEIESGLLDQEDIGYTLEDLTDLIEFGFKNLIKSNKLKDFEIALNEVCILDLGKMEILVNDIVARPYFTFTTMEEAEEETEVEGSDMKVKSVKSRVGYVNKNRERLFAVVIANRGITFYMLGEDPGELSRKKTAIIKKTPGYSFKGVQYPYGKDFRLKINLNLSSFDRIERDILDQIER